VGRTIVSCKAKRKKKFGGYETCTDNLGRGRQLRGKEEVPFHTQLSTIPKTLKNGGCRAMKTSWKGRGNGAGGEKETERIGYWLGSRGQDHIERRRDGCEGCWVFCFGDLGENGCELGLRGKGK